MNKIQQIGFGVLFTVAAFIMIFVDLNSTSIIVLGTIGFLLFIALMVIGDTEEEKKKKELIKQNSGRSSIFTYTEGIEDLRIDSQNKLLNIRNNIEYYEFNEIEEIRLYQDNFTIHSGTSGGAVNFGGIILGQTGESIASKVIENIDIVLVFSGLNAQRYTYKLLEKPVKANSEEYRITLEKAERMVTVLEKMKQDNF